MKKIIQAVVLIILIVLAIGATLQNYEHKGLLIALAAVYSTYLAYAYRKTL